jgi:hypothetical protein
MRRWGSAEAVKYRDSHLTACLFKEGGRDTFLPAKPKPKPEFTRLD